MPPRWQTSDWLTAAGLAKLQLTGLPGTERGVNGFAERHGWRHSGKARRRTGCGGGWEYHLSLLPAQALNDLLARRAFVAELRQLLADIDAGVVQPHHIVRQLAILLSLLSSRAADISPLLAARQLSHDLQELADGARREITAVKEAQ